VQTADRESGEGQRQKEKEAGGEAQSVVDARISWMCAFP
jgi:hypothetical protein